MFWQDEENKGPLQPPEDIFDLAFRIEGKTLPADHAWALAVELEALFGPSVCAAIGVHHIRMAESGNGWTRPVAQGQLLLSRRARLIIRVSNDELSSVNALSGNSINLNGHRIVVGESKKRKLSTLDTVYAHAIEAESNQSEELFLQSMAVRFDAMGVKVSRMICGISGSIDTREDPIYTRSLMVAGLKPEESILLQRQGVGDKQLLGCGLFIPHRGIDAVATPQQNDF